MSNTSQDVVIAVFEHRPYWGPELQRQFGHTDVSIRECRVMGDLQPAIEGFRSALIVMDLEADLVACLAWLGSAAKSNCDRCAIIACGSPATVELEWRLREAGVTAFLPDVIPGNDFARLCRKLLGLRSPG